MDRRSRIHGVRLVLCGAVLAVVGVAASAAAEPAAPAQPLALRQPALLTPKALGAAMLAVTQAGGRLVAAGERGTVLWSDDQGQHWQQAQVPVQATLTALRFLNARTGWAVGHLGVVLRTDDGGQTWVRQLDGTQVARLVLAEAQASGDEAAVARAQRFVEEGPDKPFFDVAFSDAQHGFVVGAYGLLLSTDDGGTTWRSIQQRLDNRLGVHLHALQVQGPRVTIAGEQGLLVQSSDAGAHFKALPSPYKGSFFGLLGTREGALLVFGLRGNALRSTDGGQQWQPVQFVQSAGQAVGLSAGLQLADGRVVLLAQNGDLLLSRDDGASFTRQAAPRPMPAAGLAAGRGELVVASLRGLQHLPLPP